LSLGKIESLKEERRNIPNTGQQAGIVRNNTHNLRIEGSQEQSLNSSHEDFNLDLYPALIRANTREQPSGAQFAAVIFNALCKNLNN
jgi:hypothetical protein